MINPIDKILTEWAYRVHNGMPDLSDNYHLIQLEQYLNELRLPRRVVKKVLEKVRAYKGKGKRTGSGTGGDPFVYTYDGGSGKQTSKDDDIGTGKNKEVEDDIDFSGKNTPESITEEIKPIDDDFNARVENGEIKRNEYKEDTIEINGKTYNQPLSVEDVESFFPNPPHKIPKRYIKALQRLLASQNKGGVKITDFLDGVGAGELPAQAAELLTLMTATMSEEESNEFYEVLQQTVGNQTTKGPLDKDWVEAAKASKNTILRQIKEKYGEDATIEFGGWDVPNDVTDGIGLTDYKKDKGFSTDAYFRVQTKDGPKIHEVSLKKDLDAFFANLGSADIQKRLDESGVESFEAEGDLSAEQVKERDSVSNLTKNQTKRSTERMGKIKQENVDRVLDKSNEEIEKNAHNLPSRPKKIKGKLLSGNKKDGYKLSKEAQQVLDFHRKVTDKYPLPWNENTLNDPEFQRLAKEAGFSMTTAKGRNKLMVYTNYLLYNEELANGITDGPAFQFLNNQLGMKKDENPPGSAKDVSNKHIENLAKPESREVLMELIKDKFPLKSLMSGEESMALSNQSLDPETCKVIFGTDDYDEIQKGISVETDEDGNKYLVYKGKTPGAKPIRIATISCRQRGDGYASPTTELAPTEELRHRMYCANRAKIKEKDYTKAERKTINRVIKKFGNCGGAKY